jgi:aldose sugar dehydrogenase
MGVSAVTTRGDRPSSGYARYIGRVGGLAFALGIGAAVLTGQAVASADTGDSGAGNAGGTTSSSAPSHHPRTDVGPKARLSRKSSDTESKVDSDDVQKSDRTSRPSHRLNLTPRKTRTTAKDDATVTATEPATATDDAGSTTLTLTAPTPAPVVSNADRDVPVNRFAGLVNVVTSSLVGNSGTKTTQTVDAAAASTVVASGLREPTDFQFLPDGRILVAEKGGRIRIVEDGVVSKQPVGRLPVLTQGERGLGGLAVDPDFATNGYIYVAYTTRGVRDRLARLTVIGDKVAFGSQKILLESKDRSTFFHHGGGLGFGPDGTLYWGVGDNRNGANAQDLGTIHGKIIRINPDGTVPSDNPDLGPDALPQIYAYGLRNPFRLTFTPTGQLLVADVGENSFEELNLVTAGGNYGWPGAEGNCSSCSSINPIYTYAHNGKSAAITSVLFYNGGVLGPEYQNKVFIADEVQGWIKVLTCNANFSSCGNVQDFDPQAGTSVVLRQAPDGSIYQLTYSPGQLVRITGPATSAAQIV